MTPPQPVGLAALCVHVLVPGITGRLPSAPSTSFSTCRAPLTGLAMPTWLLAPNVNAPVVRLYCAQLRVVLLTATLNGTREYGFRGAVFVLTPNP